MRVIILVACVLAACSESHGGEPAVCSESHGGDPFTLAACSESHGGEPLTGDAAISTVSPDALVGVWSAEQGPCTHSMLFGSSGRYEAAVRCPDGDDRDEAGEYEARDGVLYTYPDAACTAGDWSAPFVVTGSHLIMAGFLFYWLDDEGPFAEPVACG